MMSAKRRVRQKMKVKPNHLEIRPTMKMWKKVRIRKLAKVRKEALKPKNRVQAGNISKYKERRKSTTQRHFVSFAKYRIIFLTEYWSFYRLCKR